MNLYKTNDEFVKKIYRNVKKRISWDDVKPDNTILSQNVNMSNCHYHKYSGFYNGYLYVCTLGSGVTSYIDELNFYGIALYRSSGIYRHFYCGSNFYKNQSLISCYMTPVMFADKSQHPASSHKNGKELYFVKVSDAVFDVYIESSSINGVTFDGVYFRSTLNVVRDLSKGALSSLPTGAVKFTEIDSL